MYWVIKSVTTDELSGHWAFEIINSIGKATAQRSMSSWGGQLMQEQFNHLDEWTKLSDDLNHLTLNESCESGDITYMSYQSEHQMSYSSAIDWKRVASVKCHKNCSRVLLPNKKITAFNPKSIQAKQEKLSTDRSIFSSKDSVVLPDVIKTTGRLSGYYMYNLNEKKKKWRN